MSSIARAFTMRRKRSEATNSTISEDSTTPKTPVRAASMRFSEKSVDIKKISGPVKLLSTTNMISYNAPDVSTVRAQRKASSSVSSGSSTRSRASADESDASFSSRDTALTDVSSIGSNSPTSSPKHERDEKPGYFDLPTKSELRNSKTLSVRKSVSTADFRNSSQAFTLLTPDVTPGGSPAIPQRSPSHSKKAHVELARKRSLQGMSRTNSLSSLSSTQREIRRQSVDFFNGKASDSSSQGASTPQVHPFGKELEQLDEVAEEFGNSVRDAEREDDLIAMRKFGLVKFCANDYMCEIEPLFGGLFGRSLTNSLHVPQVAWI